MSTSQVSGLGILRGCPQRLGENDLLFTRSCVDSLCTGRGGVEKIGRMQFRDDDLALFKRDDLPWSI
jgi:hypothetical protein